jgi:acyl dehydratase
MIRLPEIGEKAESKKVYSTISVIAFAELSGDINPVHLDVDFASTTIFQKPIVHGIFVASQISELIANCLPGPGSIYINQTLSFKNPVYHEDEITCVVEVISIKEEKNIVELSTVCINKIGKIIIDGIAIIKIV